MADSLKDKLSRGIRGAYAQANPFDAGRTWDTTQKGLAPGYRQASSPTPTPSYQPSTTKIDTSALDKELEASRNNLKALQAQLAAQPRLPVYDSSAAWARAQKQAESVVNPVYVDKLNQYLEAKKLKVSQQQGQTDLNKKNIQTGLTQTLEDSVTARTRTAEDTDASIADVNATEGEFQEASGTAFDRARRALLESQGDFGSSGLVAQTETDAIDDRNAEEAAQTRQFEKERRAVETLKTRTFADLDKADDRAKGDAASKVEQEDFNLKSFIDSADLEEKEYRYQNELERNAEIASQVNNQYAIGVREFINSLIGSGARPQDIALAQQVYGI